MGQKGCVKLMWGSISFRGVCFKLKRTILGVCGIEGYKRGCGPWSRIRGYVDVRKVCGVGKRYHWVCGQSGYQAGV